MACVLESQSWPVLKKKKWLIKNHRTLESGYQVVLGRTITLHRQKDS